MNIVKSTYTHIPEVDQLVVTVLTTGAMNDEAAYSLLFIKVQGTDYWRPTSMPNTVEYYKQATIPGLAEFVAARGIKLTQREAENEFHQTFPRYRN